MKVYMLLIDCEGEHVEDIELGVFTTCKAAELAYVVHVAKNWDCPYVEPPITYEAAVNRMQQYETAHIKELEIDGGLVPLIAI